MNFTTEGVEGISMPAQIAAGDRWSQKITFRGSGNIGGSEFASRGTETFNFAALGDENVTVPAGEFNAMKIQTDIRLETQLDYQGSMTPSTSTFSILNYWVAGVGLVKMETTADVSGSVYSEVIELQSYNIP